jgi:hypothetical protein
VPAIVAPTATAVTATIATTTVVAVLEFTWGLLVRGPFNGLLVGCLGFEGLAFERLSFQLSRKFRGCGGYGGRIAFAFAVATASATTATTTTPATATVCAGSAFADLFAFRSAICAEELVFGGSSYRSSFGLRVAGTIIAASATTIVAIAAFSATFALLTTAFALFAVATARGAFEVGGVAGFFHEIRDVEEGVALETDVYEAGLHSGKDAGDTTVIDGASECVLVLALIINLGKFVFFDDGKPRFVRCA